MDVGYENKWYIGMKMFFQVIDYLVSLFVNLFVVFFLVNQLVGLLVGQVICFFIFCVFDGLFFCVFCYGFLVS